MPRPVVPILAEPAWASRARSSSPWTGRIRGVFSATMRVSGVTATPCPASLSISARSAQGSSTTPLPMTDSLPRTTPEGRSESL
jgi:hypothetical protein